MEVRISGDAVCILPKHVLLQRSCIRFRFSPVRLEARRRAKLVVEVRERIVRDLLRALPTATQVQLVGLVRFEVNVNGEGTSLHVGQGEERGSLFVLLLLADLAFLITALLVGAAFLCLTAPFAFNSTLLFQVALADARCHLSEGVVVLLGMGVTKQPVGLLALFTLAEIVRVFAALIRQGWIGTFVQEPMNEFQMSTFAGDVQQRVQTAGCLIVEYVDDRRRSTVDVQGARSSEDIVESLYVVEATGGEQLVECG